MIFSLSEMKFNLKFNRVPTFNIYITPISCWGKKFNLSEIFSLHFHFNRCSSTLFLGSWLFHLSIDSFFWEFGAREAWWKRDCRGLGKGKGGGDENGIFVAIHKAENHRHFHTLLPQSRFIRGDASIKEEWLIVKFV